MDLITQFRTMAQYNTLMNRSIYDACGALSDEEGSFVEPLACCVRAVQRTPMSAGDSVVVMGLGSVGLLMLQAVKAIGAAQVYSVDLLPERLRLALKLGARAQRGGVRPGFRLGQAIAGKMLHAHQLRQEPPALLDAAEFPEIRVAGVTLSGTLDALNADLTISVAGHEASVSAPFSLQGDAHTLTAVGSLALRQTALGITPYSLLHGALQVEDVMQLKFRIVVPIS